jgi:hypothetical protein
MTPPPPSHGPHAPKHESPRQHDPFTLGLATAGAVVPAVVVVGVPQPLQALLAAVLLLALPGAAVVRLLDPALQPLPLLVLAMAISLALAGALSTALLYAGTWSWQVCCVLLGAVTLTACAVRGAGVRT